MQLQPQMKEEDVRIADSSYVTLEKELSQFRHIQIRNDATTTMAVMQNGPKFRQNVYCGWGKLLCFKQVGSLFLGVSATGYLLLWDAAYLLRDFSLLFDPMTWVDQIEKDMGASKSLTSRNSIKELPATDGKSAGTKGENKKAGGKRASAVSTNTASAIEGKSKDENKKGAPKLDAAISTATFGNVTSPSSVDKRKFVQLFLTMESGAAMLLEMQVNPPDDAVPAFGEGYGEPKAISEVKLIAAAEGAFVDKADAELGWKHPRRVQHYASGEHNWMVVALDGTNVVAFDLHDKPALKLSWRAEFLKELFKRSSDRTEENSRVHFIAVAAAYPQRDLLLFGTATGALLSIDMKPVTATVSKSKGVVVAVTGALLQRFQRLVLVQDAIVDELEAQLRAAEDAEQQTATAIAAAGVPPSSSSSSLSSSSSSSSSTSLSSSSEVKGASVAGKGKLSSVNRLVPAGGRIDRVPARSLSTDAWSAIAMTEAAMKKDDEVAKAPVSKVATGYSPWHTEMPEWKEENAFVEVTAIAVGVAQADVMIYVGCADGFVRALRDFGLTRSVVLVDPADAGLSKKAFPVQSLVSLHDAQNLFVLDTTGKIRKWDMRARTLAGLSTVECCIPDATMECINPAEGKHLVVFSNDTWLLFDVRADHAKEVFPVLNEEKTKEWRDQEARLLIVQEEVDAMDTRRNVELSLLTTKVRIR